MAKTGERFALSHPMGEGRGEGLANQAFDSAGANFNQLVWFERPAILDA